MPIGRVRSSAPSSAFDDLTEVRHSSEAVQRGRRVSTTDTAPYTVSYCRTYYRLNRRGSCMTVNFRLYRGLEINLLVFPRCPTLSGHGHNYEDGFDAAVRIREPEAEDGRSRSRVFRLPVQSAYESAGDARRACTAYAERLISTSPESRAFFGLRMDDLVREPPTPQNATTESRSPSKQVI